MAGEEYGRSATAGAGRLNRATPARSLVLLVLVALAPLWLVGIFGRALWTPDEPREADIAWRMSQQADRTLPQLAGRPFLEKPPLTYWMSGMAVAALGDTAAAARTPNLIYVVVTGVAVGALALAMGLGVGAALVAVLVAASALLTFRVGIWLAPDACLVAGNALALLGVWRGYNAPPGGAKLRGYALMHLGAAIGFMAKSAPGWLVPGLALVTLIAWERRWSELRRPELYAGLLVQALIIGPWIAAVAATSAGADALRTLFWNNTVGRFMQVKAPVALDYTTGHHNTFGKYFLELPYYLLPWTFLAAAALRSAWTCARVEGSAGRPWRFALCASVPLLVLLSVSATARDVYAAPALLGLGLLTGLWVARATAALGTFDALCLLATRVLVTLLTGAFVAALAALALSGTAPRVPCLCAMAVVIAMGVLAWRGSAQAQRAGNPAAGIAWSYAGYASALAVSALVVMPVIDQWQDLGALARHVRADTAVAPLALLDPDETTLAIMDHGSGAPFAVLDSTPVGKAAALREWFAAYPDARVLVLLPGHASGTLRQWFARIHTDTPAGDGALPALTAPDVASLAGRYELPQGRRYALLGPPAH